MGLSFRSRGGSNTGRPSSAQIMAREGKYATIRMPSGEMRLIPIGCRATIGQVGNVEHEIIRIGKAGKTRHLGIRPTVRGSVMNPSPARMPTGVRCA